ncbi:hypothetical protein D9611_011293 [Ephemerocybe angulata]|uniref:Uncharacterized protein n=1 Tax=Ephemerocybe angulata TaxID=980116 RepID=A0A8H5F1N9_9AGAR|nr:hypothetical protein D9611_011293 [Tulosesus angulatus]
MFMVELVVRRGVVESHIRVQESQPTQRATSLDGSGYKGRRRHRAKATSPALRTDTVCHVVYRARVVEAGCGVCVCASSRSSMGLTVVGHGVNGSRFVEGGELGWLRPASFHGVCAMPVPSLACHNTLVPSELGFGLRRTARFKSGMG